MNANRIVEIGKQLHKVADSTADEIKKDPYMSRGIKASAVQLFEEAVGLGALNAPENGLLKGMLAANTRTESDWHFWYFENLIFAFTQKQETNLESVEYIASGVRLMGDCLLNQSHDESAIGLLDSKACAAQLGRNVKGVTRWMRSNGAKKIKGQWMIDPNVVDAYKKKNAPHKVVHTYYCPSCDHEVKAGDKPTHCPKCNRDRAFIICSRSAAAR